MSSFDLTDRNQFLQACHYTNLQPLWAKDNICKRDKILWSHYLNGSNGGSGKLANASILHLTNAILAIMISADIKAGGAKSAAKCYIMYERI